jgi:hypothetical protein
MYNVVQAHGTGTLPIPNLSQWDSERSKETCPLSQGQVIYPRWRPVLVLGTDSIPTMEPVPAQPVPIFRIKWDYKAVEYFNMVYHNVF